MGDSHGSCISDKITEFLLWVAHDGSGLSPCCFQLRCNGLRRVVDLYQHILVSLATPLFFPFF